MDWLIAAFAGMVFVEVFGRLPTMTRLAKLWQTVLRVIAVTGSRRISDHWKEKALLRYAVRLLALTTGLAACLAFAVAPVIALCLIAFMAGTPILEFVVSPVGMLFVTVVSLCYAFIRYRPSTKHL